jgi:hypothetical protein
MVSTTWLGSSTVAAHAALSTAVLVPVGSAPRDEEVEVQSHASRSIYRNARSTISYPGPPDFVKEGFPFSEATRLYCQIPSVPTGHSWRGKDLPGYGLLRLCGGRPHPAAKRGQPPAEGRGKGYKASGLGGWD